MKDDETDELLIHWSKTKLPEPEKREEILRNILNDDQDGLKFPKLCVGSLATQGVLRERSEKMTRYGFSRASWTPVRNE